MSRALRIILVASLLAACRVGGGEDPAAPADEPSPPQASIMPSTLLDEVSRNTLRPLPTRTTTPTVTPTTSAPPAIEFAFNLYDDGDFVPQYTFEWCVGASIQMAWNLVRAEPRTSRDDQEAMWELARDQSSNSFNGANPRGWAAALEAIGIGPYELVSVPEYDDALRTAAAAIRLTGRPVGIVMWRGRHAWVMSGFESIGDPILHADFEITGVRVLDPLYPHGSGTWGPSPEPNSLLTPAELAEQFVLREPRRWSSDLERGYPLVLPMPEGDRTARR